MLTKACLPVLDLSKEIQLIVLHQYSQNKKQINLETKLRDRPEFITGGDGFKGSHLVGRLVGTGFDSHVFVRATSCRELNNIQYLYDTLRVLGGVLRDEHSVTEELSSLKEHNDKFILHLTAQANLGESWEHPYETVDTIINGLLNLLQSMIDLDLDIAKFDTAGTVKN